MSATERECKNFLLTTKNFIPENLFLANFGKTVKYFSKRLNYNNYCTIMYNHVQPCRAVDAGVCGVPSFTVNSSSEVVWGQDRLNVVADYICGCKNFNAKL